MFRGDRDTVYLFTFAMCVREGEREKEKEI